MEYLKFQDLFPDEKVALNFIYDVVIGDQYKCPHCGSTRVYRRKDMPKNFLCKSCNNHYSGLRGTIFEYTSTELRKWLYGIYAYNKGYLKTAMKFKNEVGVTYKTAWRVMACIKRSHDLQEQRILDKLLTEMNRMASKAS